MTISGYKDVPENNEASLIKALAHQPVSVAIEASGRDFQFYSGVSKIWNLWIVLVLLLFGPNAAINIITCAGRF